MVITSPYADVELAEVTLTEFVLGQARARGDRAPRSATWGEQRPRMDAW